MELMEQRKRKSSDSRVIESKTSKYHDDDDDNDDKNGDGNVHYQNENMNENDGMQIDDVEVKKKENGNERKKLGIKLASFADLGHNGITDQSPICNSDRGCYQCSKEIDAIFNAIVWETMLFCDEKCLQTYQNRLNNCSCCLKRVQTSSMGKYCVRFGSDIKQFCSNVCLEEHKKVLKVCCYCQRDISSGLEGFLAPIGDKGQFKDFCKQECLQRYEAINSSRENEAEINSCAVCSEVKKVEMKVVVFSKEGQRSEKGYDEHTKETKTEVILLCSHPCYSAYTFGKTLSTHRCDLCESLYDVRISDRIIYFHGLSKRFCSIGCQNVYVMRHRKIVSCTWCNVKKYNFDMIEKWTSSSTSSSSSISFVSEENSSSSSSHYCSIHCLTSHCSSPVSTLPIIQSISSLATKKEEGRGTKERLPTEPLPIHALPTSLTALPSFLTPTERIIRETIVKLPEEPERKNKSTSSKPYTKNVGVSMAPLTNSVGCQTSEFSSETPCLFPITVPMILPFPIRMYQMPVPIPLPIPLPIPVPIFLPTTKKTTKSLTKHLKKLSASSSSSSALEPNTNDGLSSDLSLASPLREEKPVSCLEKDDDENDDWSNDSEQQTPRRNSAGKSHVSSNVSSEDVILERPDSKQHLKFVYGVNAWRNYWSSVNRLDFKKRFDPLTLQLDELNASLIVFVTEVRKDNDESYSSGSLLYLLLGIQLYLLQNGKLYNILLDLAFESFTSILHGLLVNSKCSLETDTLMTVIQEEDLWESQQLGCESPMVLLNTLLYYNTKYFLLNSSESHSKLSLSQVLQVSNGVSDDKSHNQNNKRICLRYYAPRNGHDDKTQIIEQHENLENLSRCPVKYYEQYIDKCPESIKRQGDVFYLQPEENCLAEDRFWFTGVALDYHTLDKMFRRILLVREIQESLS